MARSPVGDWQELSALYEEADGLDAPACAALLERLRREGHPQLGALEQMLRARDHVRSDAFMDRLPSLPSLAPPRPGEGTVSAGDHFGPYSLVRRLGMGGMAQVWLADRDDGAFQRHVAIKLPFRHAEGAQRETLVQRFARERDILAALHHPNIAALHDAGVTPAGQPWLALELVEGEAITDWCDRQRLAVRERVRLFRQVLRAVQHAHANLVIHRDLKPANILVTPQGNVRLLDFGIAKLIEPVDGLGTDSELTREGGTPLTLKYASPEQLTGLPLTTACDVYSLGVVLYELLAGVRPYEPKIDSAAQIEQAIVEHEPRAPSRREPTPEILAARNVDAAGLRRDLAPDLDAIVLHALAKQAQHRYASAEAFLADLDRWLGGQPVSARRPTAWYWMRKFVARHRVGVALGAGAVASLIVATAVAVVMGLQARQESARAVAARDFLLGMFKQADPEHSSGRELSARELLEAAQVRARTELRAMPELQGDLLRGIAEVQSYIGDYRRAKESLNTVLIGARASGDPRRVAGTLVDLADTSLHMGDSREADRFLGEARAAWPQGAADPAFLARTEWVRGWVMEQRGMSAIERLPVATAALDHARQSFGSDHRQTVEAMRLLASVVIELRNFEEASRLLLEAEQRADAQNLVSRRDLIGLRRDRVAVVYAAGEFSRFARELASLRVDCERTLGEWDDECGMVRVRMAVTLLMLGRGDAARGLLPALVRQAGARESPRRQVESQIVALRVASANGLLREHPVLAAEVAALARSKGEVPVYERSKVSAALALAEASLRDGNHQEAIEWVRLAQQRLADADRPDDARLLGRIRMFEAVGLAQADRHAQALDAFDAARRHFERAYGADSPLELLFRLNRIPSLVALGRVDEAAALVQLAEPVLRRGAGDESIVERARSALHGRRFGFLA